VGPVFGLHAVGKRKSLPVTVNCTDWLSQLSALETIYLSTELTCKRHYASFFFRPRVDLQLYSFFNLDTRWAWVVNASPRNDPVSIHCTGG
jgi:hypothetical protein